MALVVKGKVNINEFIDLTKMEKILPSMFTPVKSVMCSKVDKIMIEVPAAAILAEELIKRCDFFSIGTNDLIQYVIAADRLGEGTSYLYDNFHPAVLRLISIVADAANKAGKKVSVCGEMGGDPTAALAFLSMGIRDLSMLSTLIPKIKKVIKEIDTSKLAPIKNKILQAKKSSEIKNILNDYLLAGVNLK